MFVNRLFTFLFLSAPLLMAAAAAQSTISGHVTGIVSDPTGAILPSLNGDASPRLIQIQGSITF